MLFNSFEFIVFFTAVTGLYFLLPHKYRWILLLISSCIFYMAFVPTYILILLVTIIIDYFAGIYIEREPGSNRKNFLLVSIISTCLVLFIFKYFNFFNENIALIAKSLHWNYPIKSLSIILPIGLSFHTFQSLSYVIEVYKGKQKAEKNFGIYALYVMFYPQLVAGPIERPQNLLHQFHEEHKFDYDRVVSGLRLMLWGYFKKVVIADRLALLVNTVYSSPKNYEGLPLIIATLFFSIQIFCDFSGYSDIAIGAARVLGFKLMKNFDRPYHSKSVTEFWRRWHISLSTWFKDYVYIPLGGSRAGVPRQCMNVLITFLLSGLWHGASWTFVAWGGIHGIYLIIERLTKGIRANIEKAAGKHNLQLAYNVVQVCITFMLTTFAWIFFRAETISDAIYIVKNMFISYNYFSNIDIIKQSVFNIGFGLSSYIIVAVSILIMEVVHLLQTKCSIQSLVSARPLVIRWMLYYAVLFYILFFGMFRQLEFIYFQF